MSKNEYNTKVTGVFTNASGYCSLFRHMGELTNATARKL